MAATVSKPRVCAYFVLHLGFNCRVTHARSIGDYKYILVGSHRIWPEQMFVPSGIKHTTVYSVVAVRLVYAGRREATLHC